MIRYALRCDKGHDFDGWFRSAAGFDRLNAEGQVNCSICGSPTVEKAPMAPAVPSRDETGARPLDQPGSALEAAMTMLRRHVEENSDYVGESFAATARQMHDGEIPHRLIHGEARPDEARKLLEDGVPVAPLPFRVTRKLS
ncbi:DUF1178 family protein [Paracoccus sp. MC1854]|uniref:DUF1178 family protein n=1 Tax=Paracoccus sp. MC1854 TaxID=2760306 RepID=UPI001600A7CE|nr:DUF1178 family protein [Paracoccus sp. MC1854]MBB1490542.1 DUF1178 family protein [Paracoccus sp. MC1854]